MNYDRCMQHIVDGGSLARLRRSNRSTILAALAEAGVLSRADIARTTGLSRTTVSSLVRELLADGMVTERPDRGQPHKGGSGRPSTLLMLTTPPAVAVGVDLGHRHICVAVAELNSPVLAEREIVLDVDHHAAAALDSAARLVGQTVADAGIEPGRVVGVGMGIPGPLDRQTGRITSSILPGWRDLAPGEELQQRLHLPVSVDNDANMGARGELAYGAARGLQDVIYVKVSNGLGAGLVLSGRLYHGTTGIAGELGHVQLREDGAVCRCGSRGCLETQVAAPKLVELLQPAHDETLTVDRILELARQHDAGVNRVLDDAGRAIGRALADLCNTLNPAAIVVGGTIGASDALLHGIRDSVDRYAQPNTVAAVRIIPGELAERAEVMGAVALALDQHTAAV